MRIGIFSDTHSNLEALTAVLEDMDRRGVEQRVCLGDTVGYGADPNEACDLVRQHAAFTILGNHDAAVAGRMDYSYYYDAARHALDLHASIITGDNMEWLKGLPYEVRQGHISFCHGSPVNLEEFEYVFSPEQAARCIPDFDRLADVTFIGHSHLCKSFALARDEVYEVVSNSFPLRPGMRYIVSVGSVGQPRDYDPRSGYVLYDDEAREVTFVRVSYDIDAAAKKIFSTTLERNFGNRLFLGV